MTHYQFRKYKEAIKSHAIKIVVSFVSSGFKSIQENMLALWNMVTVVWTRLPILESAIVYVGLNLLLFKEQLGWQKIFKTKWWVHLLIFDPPIYLIKRDWHQRILVEKAWLWSTQTWILIPSLLCISCVTITGHFSPHSEAQFSFCKLEHCYSEVAKIPVVVRYQWFP